VRQGFKIRRLYGCASSSLATGTKYIKGLAYIAKPFLLGAISKVSTKCPQSFTYL